MFYLVFFKTTTKNNKMAVKVLFSKTLFFYCRKYIIVAINFTATLLTAKTKKIPA